MRLLLAFLMFFTFNAHAIRITLPQGSGGGGGNPTVPIWQSFTVNFSDFTAVANQEDILLYTLPADDVLHAIHIKHSTSFSGGSITDYSLSVGPVGDLDGLASDFNVFQATGGSVLQNSANLITLDQSSPVAIRVRATSVGDTLNNATAGVATVRVLVSSP